MLYHVDRRTENNSLSKVCDRRKYGSIVGLSASVIRHSLDKNLSLGANLCGCNVIEHVERN